MWFVIEFDNQPIGYEQLQWTSLDDQRFAVLRRTQLQLKRLGNDVSLRANLTGTQLTDGRLLDFQLERSDASGHTIRRFGAMDNALTTMTTEETVTGTRRTNSDHLGGVPFSPFLELWLPTQLPNEAGRKTFPVYFPESAGVANIIAERKLPRSIRLPNQPAQTLSRIAFYPAADATRVTTWYLNEANEVVRTERRMLNGTLSMTRTTADEALAAAANGSLDTDAQSLIPVSQIIDRRDPNRPLQLDLTVQDGFLSDLPNGPNQTVARLNAGGVRITLAPRNESAPRPTNALKSTRWMKLDDPALIRLAAFASGPKTGSGRQCRRLTDYVHSKMRPSGFSAGFNSAQDVAQSMEGDCTEHAVLLAALLRCQKIPSRIAGGLASVGRRPGFVGHTWVEAWYDGAWHAFDSATGEDRTVIRIKLTDSTLPDEATTGLTLFQPVLQIVGRAKITVVKE